MPEAYNPSDVADEVVSRINAGVYSETVTSRRVVVPDKSFESVTGLEVVVSPQGVESSIVGREATELTVSVSVAVMKKVTAKTATVVDPLIDLVEAIKTQLRLTNYEIGTGCASWAGVVHEPIYDTDALLAYGVFSSVFQAVYRVRR